MSTVSDIKVASVAAGFTLGFGLLTVWEAIKQTKMVRSPLRSHYVYMIWVEIFVNAAMGIIAWLLLDGTLVPTVPVLLVALLLWVFEVQLLMQIIINRAAVIADDPRTIFKIKWGTVIVLCMIQIAVFCIWIPTHSFPPPSPIFGMINKYWDPTSKCLICLIDAALNYYFIRTVNQRLVKYHGLVKYKPLATFNARLLVVSVLMDVMLVGLMFLKNPMVYTQFHPVAYMVKLNIEMTMATLIKKIAQASISEREARSNASGYHTNPYYYGNGSSNGGKSHRGGHTISSQAGGHTIRSGNHTFATSGTKGKEFDEGTAFGGDVELADRNNIHKVTTFRVTDEDISTSSSGADGEGTGGRKHQDRSDDALPLHRPE